MTFLAFLDLFALPKFRRRPVPEVASEIAEAIRGFTDAVRQLSGVMAWGVAESHSDTHGRQAEMAAVILRFAHEGYFHTKVDGRKVCDADADEARAMLDKLFAPKGRRR